MVASSKAEVENLKAEGMVIGKEKDDAVAQLEEELGRNEQIGTQLRVNEETKQKAEREVKRLMEHLLQVKQ